MSKNNTSYQEEQQKQNELMDKDYQEFLLLKEKYEKDLFDMAYNWGSWGIVTNEKCNTFQETLKKLTDIMKLL